MPSQEIQWLAVPFDVEEQTGKTILSVAVCVQPRLQDVSSADRVLSDYKDWLDWPSTLGDITVTLNVDGTIVSPVPAPGTENPDSENWKAIFPPTTLVRPYEYTPFTDYKIISYPIKKVNETIYGVFQALVKDFDGAPPVLQPVLQFGANDTSFASQIPKLFTSLKDVIPNDDNEKQLQSIKSRWEDEGEAAMMLRIRNGGEIKKSAHTIEKRTVPVPADPQQMMYANTSMENMLGGLGLVDLYYTARTVPVKKLVGGKLVRTDRAPMLRPKFDFHQVVSILREYPAMMRRLGLVRHVQFELPASMSAAGKIRCEVSWASPQVSPSKNITPWTAYTFDNSGSANTWQFLPRPEAGSEIIGPLLCLNDASHFDVIQIDVDTSAIKTLNYTRTLVHRYKRTTGTRDVQMKADPPATRGTGLQLVRHNRALKLARALIRNAQNYNRLVSDTDITLYADDLLRGYRIDVFDATANSWQSLMRRNATYRFPNAAEPLKSTGFTMNDEEGVLTMAATRPVDSDDVASQKQLYAHETVAQWEGWSLVAPQIGNHIGTDDALATESKQQAPPADFEYQVSTEFSVVEGSLPRLRFGRNYRLRARFADIAGNGPKLNELDSNDFSCASELIRYLRWDPIVSPAIVLRNHPVEGESPERAVIRNYNADTDDSVSVDTTETSERHLFPPLASVQISERHGMFDQHPLGKMKGDAGTYNMIAGKLKDIPSRWYTRNDAGDLVPEASDDTPPADPSKAKDAIRFALVQSGTTEAPYLPDPIARGITLANVPGLTAGQLFEVTLSGENMATITSAMGVATVAFDDIGQWPKLNSIIIRLAAGSGAPTWNSGTRTLTILLPKGEQAWVQFSSTLGADQGEANNNFDLHGHKGTLEKSGYTSSKLAAAARGLSWLVTPARTLHLVHATQKPLKKPKVISASVSMRNFGATNAGITIDNTYVDGRTTQKVDMHAGWPMWEDNLNKPAPELLEQRAFFYEQHVEDRTNDKLDNTKTHEFGDTKYRSVTYIPTATTRFREYLPLSIRKLAENITRKGIGKELKVLSTKRPDSVKLLYIVPSFRWLEPERKLDGSIVKSTRKGGGLRVYMERPWYSSGNDELLGIVLYSTKKFKPKVIAPESGFKSFQGYYKGLTPSKDLSQGLSKLLGSAKLDIPEQIKPYVTEWGMDPIWLSKPTPTDAAPRPANFRDPEVILNNVSLEETPLSQRYDVIGYKPLYDAERRLWYCDIEINPGESYYPFVRLALCRLQPNSLADAQTGKDVYCSRISQSEFCQLAPDREATVRIEEDRQSITIQVVGHTYRINTTGQLGSEIEATIEKNDGGQTDVAWTPVHSQRIDRIHAAGLWGGLVKLPSSVDSTKYRVVIKEYEQFFSDPSDPKERETSLGNKTDGSGEIMMEFDRRIVYADVLPLY